MAPSSQKKEPPGNPGRFKLTELPERMAILKTKGCEPRLFATYDLPESDGYDLGRELLRERNRLDGYTRSLKELDDALMLSPAAFSQPDEPAAYLE